MIGRGQEALVLTRGLVVLALFPGGGKVLVVFSLPVLGRGRRTEAAPATIEGDMIGVGSHRPPVDMAEADTADRRD
jgi:hypothetical protein